MALTNGRLVSGRFPYLPLTFRVQDRVTTVEALLDTGFDGDVALPFGLIAAAGPPNGQLDWTLADGSGVLAPYYFGTVWIGELGPIPAVITALGDELLVGVGVAAHFTIILDHARTVVVEP